MKWNEENNGGMKALPGQGLENCVVFVNASSSMKKYIFDNKL